MKALKDCYNGDGRPVCPPSRVLCSECLTRVGEDLKKMIEDIKSGEILEALATKKGS